MARRTIALVAGLVLVVAACSSGASQAPSAADTIATLTPATASATASASASASAAPSAAGSAAASPSAVASASAAASVGRSACKEATGKGAVKVSIKDFAFDPATIKVKVGQLITFKNAGFEPHNATLDAGGCGTKTLQTGNVDGLRFTVAGTYPFHCTVHTQMTGTITVAG